MRKKEWQPVAAEELEEVIEQVDTICMLVPLGEDTEFWLEISLEQAQIVLDTATEHNIEVFCSCNGKELRLEIIGDEDEGEIEDGSDFEEALS